jgi:POT family proton-dependent oligopeptide transporter
MYYMSINIGSFFSMLATPWLAAKFGWSIAFSELRRDADHPGELHVLQKWVKNYGSKPDFAPVHMANCWRPSSAWSSWW